MYDDEGRLEQQEIQQPIGNDRSSDRKNSVKYATIMMSVLIILNYLVI